MSETNSPATRSFHCDSCRGEIQVPFDLPSTTGPCPHCGSSITSPPPPADPAPAPVAEAPIKLMPEPESVPPAPPEPVEERAPAAIAPLSVASVEIPKAERASEPDLNKLADTVAGAHSSAPAGAGVDVPAVPESASTPGDEMADVPAESVADPKHVVPPPRPVKAEKGKRRIHPAIPFLAAIFLIVGVLVGLIMIKRKGSEPGPPVVKEREEAPMDEAAREQFWKDGWKQIYSTNTLTAFLQASTPEEKARYVIGGAARLEEMREFYASEQKIDEADTPIELFSHFDLDISDKKRGLFLMQFERPTQYDMREFFRPVAPLEIQHRLEEPGLLLSAFAARENFAMQPVRVMAFFREVDNKLLLDWDVYAQTKYRGLRYFTTYPQPGSSKAFRVMTREVLPAVPFTGGAANVAPPRFYRFSDPAHTQDHVDLSVANESLPGRILAEIAFINIPNKEPQNRYATVELAWTEDEEPQLVLSKVHCWEFLGLGGVAGNADPADDAPLDTPVNLNHLAPDPLAPPSISTEGGVEPVSVPGVLAPAPEPEIEGEPVIEEDPGAGTPEEPIEIAPTNDGESAGEPGPTP